MRSRRQVYPIEFSCELTINVARHEDLLPLLHAAHFTHVFIGIESPRRASLLETSKTQNTRRDMRGEVERIQSFHISVAAGIIVGFDADDQAVFEEQYERPAGVGRT